MSHAETIIGIRGLEVERVKRNLAEYSMQLNASQLQRRISAQQTPFIRPILAVRSLSIDWHSRSACRVNRWKCLRSLRLWN